MARSKPKPVLEDLRRRLVLLSRLRGRPLRSAEGIAIFDLCSRKARIRDPLALYQACARGWPSAATIAATVDLATPPLILRPALLATMQRDLRALRKWPNLRQTLREAPRLFRRFGEIDSAWFTETREQLTHLAALLRASEFQNTDLDSGASRAKHPRDSETRIKLKLRSESESGFESESESESGFDGDRATFYRVRTLVAALRGEASALAIDRGYRRLQDESRDRRRRARRRLRALLAAMHADTTPCTPPLAAAFYECRSAMRLPGRSRRRLLEHSLGRLLEIPPCSERTVRAGEHKRDPIRDLILDMSAIGERLIATLPPAPNEAQRGQNRRFLALYGLAFEPLMRPGARAIELTPTLVKRALHDFKGAQEAFGEFDLTIDEVLRLRRLDGVNQQVAIFVAAGVPVATVEAIAKDDALHDFASIRSTTTALAYAEWFTTLAPHYAAMGLDLPFSAAHLQRLTKSTGTRRDLGVLALCLMAHHRKAGKAGAEAALNRLGNTLALFERRPAQADEVLRALASTSPGAGAANFPIFSTWLFGQKNSVAPVGRSAPIDPTSTQAPPPAARRAAEDLDRFVHLTHLAGRPIALSRRLRADFERDGAQLRELAYLGDIEELRPEQEHRLQRLQNAAVASGDPRRTRRRLAAEIQVLLGEAYEVQIDAIFRHLVREVWGLSFDRLTPSWRDAIRFYLQTEKNHGLLRTILRAHASGAEISRSLPANQAWIRGARERFAVDVWLSPRRRSLLLRSDPFSLAIERDPVEVLRMGVPFDTCLSITGGFNAASTVINAADANKQVLYLRDRRKRIIARKLIAISEDNEIIGYNLYISDRSRVAEITRAFADFCSEFAKDVGLPLACRGEPAQLHKGFWYDDGVEPFEGVHASDGRLQDLIAYCEALGLPCPWGHVDIKGPGLRLQEEATLYQALQDKDPRRVLAASAPIYDESALREFASTWLSEHVDSSELPAHRRNEAPLLERSFAEASVDPRRYLMLTATSESWRMFDLLSALMPSPGLARALVEVARSEHNPGRRFDDHGFEHRTLDLLPRWITAAPISEALALIGQIEGIWHWIAASSEHCVGCVEIATKHLINALVSTYAAEPDPAAVLALLTHRPSSQLARGVALAIAAAHNLADPDPTSERPAPTLVRRLARLGKRDPSLLQDPYFSAAIIRLSAGALPHGVHLPKPSRCPFPGDALGRCTMSALFSEHLESWLEAPPEAGERWSALHWNPSRWELYVRRRRDPKRPSPLRRELLRQALRRAPGASPATDWLARLGDVKALTTIDGAPHGPDFDRPTAPKPDFDMRRALVLAHSIAGQVRASEDGELQRLDRSDLELVYKRHHGPQSLDIGLIIAARDLVDRHLQGAPVDPRALDLALWILGLQGVLNPEQRHDLLLRLVDQKQHPGQLSPAHIALSQALLGQNQYRWSSWSPTLVLAVGAHKELHGALFRGLCFAFESEPGVGISTMIEIARTSNQGPLGEELARIWRAEVLDQHPDEIARTDETTFRATLREALQPDADVSGATLIELFTELRSPARIATFLDLLLQNPSYDRHSLSAALDARWPDNNKSTDDDARSHRYWLRRCIVGEISGPLGLDTEGFLSPASAATLTRP